MKQISEIKGKYDLYIHSVNFDDEIPYAIVYDEQGHREDYEIPSQFAYFITTHWPGTPQIKENARRQLQNEFKKILGIDR
ncbi:MAG: hypothetical protein WC389_16960 [Lutibacter sp.]|jgi:hypothetical protein